MSQRRNIKKKPKPGKPYTVELTALDAQGNTVECQTISLEQYYEESTELIDFSEYRQQRHIVIVNGSIFGSRGKQRRQYTNFYDAKGDYIGGRVVEEDGSVHVDGIVLDN